MESQNGLPHDPEIMDFDTELVTFSPSPRPPCNLTAAVSATVSGTVSATVPKMLFIYPRLLGRIEVPGVARQQNNQDTQDPQHAGDPSYLGVGGFVTAAPYSSQDKLLSLIHI